MRILLNSFSLLLLATTVHAQQSSLPKCELQHLAIDAALGDTAALYNLGVEFFSGTNLSRDYAWAKAGKHYSSRMTETIDNPQIGDEVAKEAEKVLADMRRRLSAVEMVEAEKKAADYIREFAPR